MAANHMTAEQAQQHWRQIGHLTTHTGGGGGYPPREYFAGFATGTLRTLWQDTERADTTECDNTPYQYPLTADAETGTTACMVDWPCPYPTHPSPFQSPGWQPPMLPHYVSPTSTEPLMIAPSLSDADVDRIARRVVELLAARGTGTAP